MSEAKKLQIVGTFVPKEVSADKIVFTEALKTTYEIGNVKLENGNGTLVKAGGTLEDFFNVFIDEKNPTITQPSVTATISDAGAYEVGTTVYGIDFKATFNPGSYSYGPDTGVEVASWTVVETRGDTTRTHSATTSFLSSLIVKDGLNYKVTATANYKDGTIPVTNLGNEYVEGQIKAGSVSTTTASIGGYRNTFYGTYSTTTVIDSASIRRLSGKSNKGLANGSSFTIDIPVGARQVIFAYPSKLRDVRSVEDVNGMHAEISSSFSKKTLPVYGVNGYMAEGYKVYELRFARPNDVDNKFIVTI